MTNITVSLETAKKMKEIGWKKPTSFYYQGKELTRYRRGQTVQLYKDTYEAPTAQEILNELPTTLEVGRIEYILTMTKKSALYLDVDIGDNMHSRCTLIVFDGDNLAEALAELRMRCVKKGRIVL